MGTLKTIRNLIVALCLLYVFVYYSIDVIRSAIKPKSKDSVHQYKRILSRIIPLIIWSLFLAAVIYGVTR